eukprot:15363316-Ditylum_brightwellii.AAC.1
MPLLWGGIQSCLLPSSRKASLGSLPPGKMSQCPRNLKQNTPVFPTNNCSHQSNYSTPYRVKCHGPGIAAYGYPSHNLICLACISCIGVGGTAIEGQGGLLLPQRGIIQSFNYLSWVKNVAKEISSTKYDKMKVSELKEEFNSRHLQTTGNKAELIQRLQVDNIQIEGPTCQEEDDMLALTAENNYKDDYV